MKLDLSINEVNVIMQALGQLPYASVFELVTKIREQAQTQIVQQQEATDA